LFASTAPMRTLPSLAARRQPGWVAAVALDQRIARPRQQRLQDRHAWLESTNSAVAKEILPCTPGAMV
jgi:hypothetical protein